jgi:hypothetical protein
MSAPEEQLSQPPFITSPTLEAMYRLPVDLGVPLLDNAITVAGLNSPRDGKTRIAVTKSDREITIKRVDGEPLQAVAAGQKMLAQPVGLLLLARSIRPSDAITVHNTPVPPRLGWEIADPEVEVASTFILEQFANLVGTFALKRQWERYTSEQLLLSNEM